MASQAHIVFDRSNKCIAQGALTNSKRPECLVRGVYPTHIKRGHGAHVWDCDGNKYIDFIGSLGANLIGHGNERIAQAIFSQYKAGSIYSMGSEIEVDAAEKVKALFPFIHLLKFLKTGSEACTAAIRIARAYHQIKKTGKTIVLSSGYHGFHDAFAMEPPAYGVLKTEEVRKFEDLSQIDDTTAAVIIEPIVTDCSKERIQYLNTLREKCTESGAILIFDEIITGFRFPKYSASSFYGIDPDIVCFGKAFAAGLPLSIVGGHRDIMNCGEYFVSSTFAGDTLALRAFVTQFELFNEGKFDMEALWAKGKQFIKRFNSIYPDGVRIDGYPTRGVFVGRAETKRLLWQEASLSNILLGPSFFFNFGHIGYEDIVLSVLSDILIRIKLGLVKPKGEAPQSPFAQRIREKQ